MPDSLACSMICSHLSVLKGDIEFGKSHALRLATLSVDIPVGVVGSLQAPNSKHVAIPRLEVEHLHTHKKSCDIHWEFRGLEGEVDVYSVAAAHVIQQPRPIKVTSKCDCDYITMYRMRGKWE